LFKEHEFIWNSRSLSNKHGLINESSKTSFTSAEGFIVRVYKCKQAHYALLNTQGNAHLVGKPEGRRPLGRPMRRWEDDIKMDL
jgi:hypothetical protein